ncbi:MAG: hypothetical protein ACXVB9_14110 [Bdellovibrionota bacterium]
MKTRSKLLKEVYPVLLLISLLMSWELTSHGSPPSIGTADTPHPEVGFAPPKASASRGPL